MPASLQTKAEIVFEDYLTRHGVAWEYETLPGLKKPDYVIPYKRRSNNRPRSAA